MRFFILAFLTIIASSCAKLESKKVEHSFYYWKTTFTSDNNTSDFIRKEGINHFYIHYFDIEWSEQYWMPVPVAEIKTFSNSIPFARSPYTPVIYITNRTFEYMDDNWCDSLAAKTRNKIIFITNRIEKAFSERVTSDSLKNLDTDRVGIPNEIQIDCDWTSSTQQKYFHFLQCLKAQFPDKKISATIRLYPYKYFQKMGVPPVDKGLLMCYNLSDIKNSKTTNSIFDLSDLKQYLTGKRYPLSLDVALPVTI
jgi:hypothetical protein